MEDLLGVNPLARLSSGQGGLVRVSPGPVGLARVSGGRSPLARRSTGHVSGGSNLERVSAGSGTYVMEVGTSQNGKGGGSAAAAAGGGGGSGSGGGRLLGSVEPLAGAIVDNRAFIGVDLRNLHPELGPGPEEAAGTAAVVGGVNSSSSGVGALDGVGGGDSAPMLTPRGATASAAGGRSIVNPFRRSSSAKPLRCEARPTGERHL